MDKITKLPWYIQIEDKGLIRESDQSKLLFYNIKHAASDYDIKYITTIANPFSDNETDKANAEYICRAVNSHEGLVEAAKLGIRSCNRLLKAADEDDKKSFVYAEIESELKQIEEALKAADGEEVK